MRYEDSRETKPERAGKTAAFKAGLERFLILTICVSAMLGICIFAAKGSDNYSPSQLLLSAYLGKASTQGEDNEGSGKNIINLLIDSDVDESVRIELINSGKEQTGEFSLAGEEPTVLIYHTHNTEAYTKTKQYSYVNSGDWRTEDNTRNVVAVGEELARLLREEYGINVIHDTSDHERPSLKTAYSRSLKTMERYKKEYPSLTLFIDLHRDAYTAEGENTDYVTIDGKRIARIMFVVGTGETGVAEDDPKPDFNSNYALAKRICENLSKHDERFVRNIRVKTGRYNQHVSPQCLLVEVGHNANTLEEALGAMPYLAKAIADSTGINTPNKVQSLQLTP